MSRKTLHVYLDRNAYRPGETVKGRIEVAWPKASPVRGVRVGLIGSESTSITVTTHRGKERKSTTYSESRSLIGEEIDLFGGPPVGWLRASSDALGRLFGRQDYPVLRAGKHTYRFEFRLPDDAPPSFEGTHAEVNYEVHAVVDVPLGPDLTFRGVVPVLPPEGLRLAACKGRTEQSGLLKADVAMVLRTDACRLEAGERLAGRIVVRNRSSKKIRGVTIRLQAVEEAQAEGHERTVTHELNEGYLPAPDPPGADQDVTFEIPVNGPFPYEGAYSRLSYRLEWTLDTVLGFDTTVSAGLEVEA